MKPDVYKDNEEKEGLECGGKRIHQLLDAHGEQAEKTMQEEKTKKTDEKEEEKNERVEEEKKEEKKENNEEKEEEKEEKKNECVEEERKGDKKDYEEVEEEKVQKEAKENGIEQAKGRKRRSKRNAKKNAEPTKEDTTEVKDGGCLEWMGKKAKRRAKKITLPGPSLPLDSHPDNVRKYIKDWKMDHDEPKNEKTDRKALERPACWQEPMEFVSPEVQAPGKPRGRPKKQKKEKATKKESSAAVKTNKRSKSGSGANKRPPNEKAEEVEACTGQTKRRAKKGGEAKSLRVIPLPKEVENMEDYWEKQEATWVRYHLKPRKELYVPVGEPGGPQLEALDVSRRTDCTYIPTGVVKQVNDTWVGDNAAKQLDYLWTGTTTFAVKLNSNKRMNRRKRKIETENEQAEEEEEEDLSHKPRKSKKKSKTLANEDSKVKRKADAMEEEEEEDKGELAGKGQRKKKEKTDHRQEKQEKTAKKEKKVKTYAERVRSFKCSKYHCAQRKALKEGKTKEEAQKIAKEAPFSACFHSVAYHMIYVSKSWALLGFGLCICGAGLRKCNAP